MPIRVANTIVRKLSKQLYYNYGKTVASRTYLLLLFSLSFIAYFSLPIVTKYCHNIITPTIQNNIPLSHLSTSLDAQCWHASAHVQFNNFTTSHHPPTQYLITEQIRLSHPNQPVTFELIQQAKQIYESISTTIVTMADNAAPVSLASICYKHHGHCLVHAPPFVQFRDENDWRSKTRLDQANTRHQYEIHPYSVYSNATFDHQGRFVKADAVLLTFVLKQNKQGNAIRIWNQLLQEVKNKYHIIDLQPRPPQISSSIWAASSSNTAHMIQYKFNLFPYDISYKAQASIVAYLIIFYLVSIAFNKSNLVKSGYSFGLAAVFLSVACFTTTYGIMDKLGISLNHVPWYLLLVAVNIGCLENIFLLTNAVLYAGCDMVVNEKISRGLQSVGVPMTATLIAELFILNVGTYMETALIKEFCMFAQVALIVDFILEGTFVIAVLSIDIKRVELADLDDRQMSKRLHELANHEFKKQAHHSDFCPIQDTPNKEDSKTCAECKDFKTHRVINAFMLCLILLVLSLFCTKEYHHHLHVPSSAPLITEIEPMQHHDSFVYQPDLNQLSDQFWSTVNPEKDTTWLQIQPAHLFIYSSDIMRVQHHVDQLQHLYQLKSMDIHYKPDYHPSLFRMFVLSVIQRALVILLSINIPVLILWLVMIAIITWMTPKWRKEWLVPLMIQCFNQSMLALIRWFCILMQFSKRAYYFYMKGQTLGISKEYDADGIHRGAITAQNIFNQQQYRSNVKKIQVHTLTHQHTTDIQDLNANAKQNLVSCGQDGRIMLWDIDHAHPTWLARLDKLYPARGGLLQATLNPDHHAKKKPHHSKHQRKRRTSRPIMLSKQLSKARCVKIDQGNRWVAAGYDDGLIRIWNVNTGTLVREMDIHPHTVEVHQESEETGLRRRFHHEPTLSQKKIDRILCVQFIGAIAEFCHPRIAEAAAHYSATDIEVSQNFIVSAHKSGWLHEWDILSGECIQTVKTGHTKDITQLHVVDSKAPHRKLGVTWVFTASKDGTVKCWERRLITKKTDDALEEPSQQTSTLWHLVYTIKQTSAVTSIATEIPVGGMGVLVTGCADGAVKVWNFETGESICFLSLGKVPTLSSSVSSTASVVSDLTARDRNSVGGPIRQFARFSHHIGDAPSEYSSSDGDDEEDRRSSASSSDSHSVSLGSPSDHRGSIYQVVVTRYCEVENGPGLCRDCDTCFGNGFLVASSGMDNKVHAWRLERSDNGHEGPCTLCTKDYHRKQYKHRKASINSNEDATADGLLMHTSATVVGRTRKRASSSHTAIKKRTFQSRPSPVVISSHDSMDTLELLDIEQLAGDTNIALEPTFLGHIDQPAGRGLVFCDKILAGVRRCRRRRRRDKSQQGEWEVWFASLQYYDPSDLTEEHETHRSKIPIETFSLDDNTHMVQSKQEKEEDQHKTLQALKGTLLGLFTSSSSHDETKMGLKYKHIHAHLSDSSDEDTKKDQEEDDFLLDDDSLEASENLPFSAIRHIISLDGSGLACDFGNFIKLVYLDKPSLTEKERLKQTRETMEDIGLNGQQIIDQIVAEDESMDLGCQCDDHSTCSPTNRGNNGCCGGVNKEKNGGKCCGGNVKQKQQEKRQQKLLFKKPMPATCGGIAECSLKNNCSRASECASANQTVTSHSSFSNWL